MTHANIFGQNLGHGPLEAVGQEALDIANPTTSASPATEFALRTNIATAGPSLAADIYDISTGSEPASGSPFAGGVGQSIPRQFDEEPGGGFADVTAQGGEQVVNAASEQLDIAVSTVGDAAGDLTGGLPSLGSIAFFGLIAGVILVAVNAFAGEAGEGIATGQ